MRKYLCLMLGAVLSANAEVITISQFDFAGPINVLDAPILGDSAGLAANLDPLTYKINDKSLKYSKMTADDVTVPDTKAINIVAADFENRHYTEAEISVDSIDSYKLYVDGIETPACKVSLKPSTHHLMLKYISSPQNHKVPVIKISADADGVLSLVPDGKRMLTLEDVMYGVRITGVDVSADGNYLLVSYSDTKDGGARRAYQRLYDVKKSAFTSYITESARWMPKTEKYMTERYDYDSGNAIIAVDPATGTETVLAHNVPQGAWMMSPTEDFIIYSLVREGPKEDPEVYRVIEPEDRQPGWRDRVYPAIYRLGDTPALQTLAISKNNLIPIDISDDGRHLLLMSDSRRITKRPTTLFTLISLDLNTLKADTLVAGDGFINGAYYSPDASRVVVTGAPEAFDRVGCTLPADVIPNAYDYQLYLVNVDDKSVKPLTRDFDPSVNSSAWSRYDGKIYLTATERDMYTMYTLDPKSGAITQINTPENVIKGIDLAATSPVAAYYGQSDSNPDALYIYNTKNAKSQCIDRPSERRLADVKIGRCIDWTFDNSRGDTVYCRYYLPDNFDPDKKYPLIVNYYGGCTPSTRTFESRYPLHVYSSLGYVVLQIQPGGATGFGQEWSSRHVSTAGKGVAEDIIEGTKQFCREMDFINPDKIGCIGASYGGFMTQYLQTVTDIFAAAVSHAGISDHTSYWGEGYWGYSYSEVSMGDDLPWSDKGLYVDQSPLYNADKVHTPILFVHGDADTNVPVGESIQMFTALKRLGVDTEMVLVADQDHHIMDDSKRKKWQNTIFAWFAKYLQDDPTWWIQLYPDHNL